MPRVCEVYSVCGVGISEPWEVRAVGTLRA